LQTRPNINFTESTARNLNQWYLVTATLNDATDTVKLYVDGIQVVSDSWTNGLSASNTNEVRIGFEAQANDILHWNGLIDDVRVYNRVLSADEVKRLYKIGATAKLGVAANNDSLAKGLVGWWTFDGKTVSGTRVFDASGTGNYGTMTNGPTLVNGKLGQAMQFGGSNDYVDVGTGLDLANKSFSISAWVKHEATGQEDAIFEFGDTGDTNQQLILTWEPPNDVMRFSFFGNDLDTPAGYPDSNWHLWSFTFDANTKQRIIFRDGAQVASDISASNFLGSGTAVINSRFIRLLKGLIDDVRVYNRVLSPDEIKRLYITGAAGKLGVAANNDSLATGLVGYWTFDGKDMAGNSTAGEYAFDVSGNGNRGKLTNGPKRVFGKIGQALQLDGVDDYVDAGDSSALQVTTQLTMSAWIKFKGTGVRYHPISKDSNESATDGWTMERENTNKIYLVTNGTFQGTTNTFTDTTQFHHIVITFNSGTAAIYYDGVNQALDAPGSPLPASLPTSTSHLNLGRDGGGLDYLNGSMDDVRIYNRALSADEVKRLYNMGR
jgi:hypothetical protein